jgi:Predicted proteasome-type protease
MTYCVGIKVKAGLVFASDSRTNAGVDQVSTYSKMHVFERPGERVFVVLSAGNLATSQAVIHSLRREFKAATGVGLAAVGDVFEAAEHLGDVSYRVQKEHADALERSGVSAEASFIIGGEVAGSGHEICLVYPQGNYISATPETPYLCKPARPSTASRSWTASSPPTPRSTTPPAARWCRWTRPSAPTSRSGRRWTWPSAWPVICASAGA